MGGAPPASRRGKWRPPLLGQVAWPVIRGSACALLDGQPNQPISECGRGATNNDSGTPRRSHWAARATAASSVSTRIPDNDTITEGTGQAHPTGMNTDQRRHDRRGNSWPEPSPALLPEQRRRTAMDAPGALDERGLPACPGLRGYSPTLKRQPISRWAGRRRGPRRGRRWWGHRGRAWTSWSPCTSRVGWAGPGWRCPGRDGSPRSAGWHSRPPTAGSGPAGRPGPRAPPSAGPGHPLLPAGLVPPAWLVRGWGRPVAW